jgi:hypothetical protein
MLKRKEESSHTETREAVDRMESEGAPANRCDDVAAVSGEVADRFVIYRGKHPHIRRSGIVLEPNSPRRVSAVVAELLSRSSDIEIAPAV